MLQSPRHMVIKSDAERFCMGEVYIPMHVDTDTEAMTASEIRKMAHKFISKGLYNCIDVQHDFNPSGCLVAESFIARKNDPDDFIEDSWVLGSYILPDELWNQVLKGELNGWSWAGTPKNKTTANCLVKLARKMVGTTEESTDGGILPPHSHEIAVAFTGDGQLVPTKTGDTMGHTHLVQRGTATEAEFEHSHRMILIEN